MNTWNINKSKFKRKELSNDLAQTTNWAKTLIFGLTQNPTEPQWLKNGATFGTAILDKEKYGTTYDATKKALD